MGKSTGGGGRFRGTERQAARALRFPGGQYLTGRGTRAMGRLNTVTGQINSTSNALSAARATSSGGQRFNASYRKQQAAKATKLQKRLDTLNRRRQVLQRGLFGSTA